MGIIDSQSVKTTVRLAPLGKVTFDKVDGRKRHLSVDSMGMVFAAVVHPRDFRTGTGRSGCSRRSRAGPVAEGHLG
jgi:hypothetical protein